MSTYLINYRELINQADNQSRIIIPSEGNIADWDHQVKSFLKPIGMEKEDSEAYLSRIRNLRDFYNFHQIYSDIFKNTDFRLQDYDLHEQLPFIAYYSNLSEKTASDRKKKKITDSLLVLHEAKILKAFRACEFFGVVMGDTIINLFRYHGEKTKIAFERLSEILKIIDEASNKKKSLSDINGHEVSAEFYTKVINRGKSLLEELRNNPKCDVNEFFQDSKKFNKSVVLWGSLLYANPENQKDLFVHIKGSSHPPLAKINEKGNFESNSNLFLHSDYDFIVENLKRTYKGKDEGYLEYLLGNIIHDLNNPSVHFVVLRNGEGETIGTIKTKKINEDRDTWYIGTFYVDEGYKDVYNIGNYLLSQIQTIQKGKKHNIATVAKNNISIQKQVLGLRGIVTDFTTEGNSLDLFKIELNNPIRDNCVSKNYGRKKILNLAKSPGNLPKNVTIENLNLEVGQDEDSISLIKKRFNAGYIMTKIFFPDDDMRNGYAIFERPNAD